MSWVYYQVTGKLWHTGSLIATGYSGSGAGKNNPAMESVPFVGPIPAGDYRIQMPRSSENTGPYVLPLTPSGHNARGRIDFQIHGDKRSDPGNASNGCIIMPRAIREKIWSSGDHTLKVKR